MAIATQDTPRRRLSDNLTVDRNPFSPLKEESTWLKFETGEANELSVTVKIYDLQGNIIRTLAEEEMVPGPVISYPWDGRDDKGKLVYNGMYFYDVKVKSDQEEREGVKAIGVFK
ncbi:MAG: FlgD immunoglobulin-like domain containing protein [bacterium]